MIETEECPVCLGAGKAPYLYRYINKRLEVAETKTCGKCNGTGRVPVGRLNWLITPKNPGDFYKKRLDQ